MHKGRFQNYLFLPFECRNHRDTTGKPIVYVKNSFVCHYCICMAPPHLYVSTLFVYAYGICMLCYLTHQMVQKTKVTIALCLHLCCQCIHMLRVGLRRQHLWYQLQRNLISYCSQVMTSHGYNVWPRALCTSLVAISCESCNWEMYLLVVMTKFEIVPSRNWHWLNKLKRWWMLVVLVSGSESPWKGRRRKLCWPDWSGVHRCQSLGAGDRDRL